LPKSDKRRLLHGAAAGRHEDVVVFVELPDRQHCRDLLAFHQREQIHDGFAARVARAFRHLIDLEPVNAAATGEAQDVIVRVGDEQLIDEIVFLHCSCLLAATATALRAVIGERLALEVAAVRQRHDHVLLRDQVLDAEILRMHDDFGTTAIRELVADLAQLVGNDPVDAFRAGQDVEQVDDLLDHLLVLGHDLFLLQPGQAGQLHVENGLGLGVRHAVAVRE
jgi:hypothetical protein